MQTEQSIVDKNPRFIFEETISIIYMNTGKSQIHVEQGQKSEEKMKLRRIRTINKKLCFALFTAIKARNVSIYQLVNVVNVT